ncbi:MAG: hypothetical protein ACP5JV_09475 [Thermus sp.]|jgi:hypothetical protein|uniref:hypothetical protein n=1 Tax=Thermus sp. TaxID=275 RepID=UPI003D0CCB3E
MDMRTLARIEARILQALEALDRGQVQAAKALLMDADIAFRELVDELFLRGEVEEEEFLDLGAAR